MGHGPRICFPKFEAKRSILLDYDRKSSVFNHLSFEKKNMAEKPCGTRAITMDRVLLFLSLRGLLGVKYVAHIRIQKINN